MVSPLAKGLFARAIGESGGALTPIAAFGPKPLAIGEADGIKFGQAMGANSLAELRAKSAQDVLQAAIKSPITFGFGVVDGYVVPEHPAKAYAEGKLNRVPLLVGSNQDEGTLFAARLVKWGPETPAYTDRIRTQFKDQADAVLKLYPPGPTQEEDKATYAALFGDEIISYGAWAWAERASATTPTWRYLFSRRPPGAPELSVYPLTGPGVYHSAELYYVFGNLADPGLAMGGRRPQAHRGHDVVLGQFRQARGSQRRRAAAMAGVQAGRRRASDAAWSGDRCGQRSAPRSL